VGFYYGCKISCSPPSLNISKSTKLTPSFLRSSYNNVLFIGVARLSDVAVVASLAYNSTVDLTGVKAVLDQKMGMTEGTHYSFTTGSNCWHLMADAESRVYILITADSYPARVATACVDDLSRMFLSKAGEKSLTCKEKALDKPCKNLFEKLCGK